MPHAIATIPATHHDYALRRASVITELDGIDVNSAFEVEAVLAGAGSRLGEIVIHCAPGGPLGSVALLAAAAALVICEDCDGLIKDRHGLHRANGVPDCSCAVA